LTTYVDDAGPVVDALDGLAALDTLSDALPFERFREAVVAALEGLRAADVLDARAGAFGVRGVALLDANTVRHLGFTAVAVVGIAERRFPPPPRQDALLLDEERAAFNAAHGWRIPLRAAGPDPEPLQFALATAAAERALQLSAPRTQDGETRPVLPSTFLLDAASRVAGHPVGVNDFERFAAKHGRRIPSGRLTPTDAREALTELGYVRALLEDGSPVGVALLRRRLTRYDDVTAAEDAHWTTVYGPHDGVLSPEGAEHLDGHAAFGRPFSPTSLEQYAKCPQRFFLSRVMGVRRDEEPEEVLRISPMDRGSVFHAIVERFMRSLPDRRPRATDWPSLSSIADEELAAAEAEGLTGHPVMWAGDRAAIREDVERWLEHEVADEDAAPLTHSDYEVRFGPSRHGGGDGPLTRDAPLLLRLPNGDTVHVAGRIDRIDWRDAPARFRVIDYKTGRARGKENALDGGRALQLPLYLLAAAEALGVNPAAGEAQYFYATRTGEYRRIAFKGEQLVARRAELDEVLAELNDGMRSGDFHAEPSRECDWCDFNTVCDTRRLAIQKRKAADPHAKRVAARRENIA
jgi:RecB family exonuclease